MQYALIVCRSLTYAQRTAALLERSGIRGQITRTPAGLSAGGCSYSVKIAQKRLTDAMTILDRAGLSPVRVYETPGNGGDRGDVL